jgi:porphobilinogen synthase
MMDGACGCVLRQGLTLRVSECGNHGYSAKYTFGVYGPFRDALDSAPKEIRCGSAKDKGKHTKWIIPIELKPKEPFGMLKNAKYGNGKTGIALLNIVREVKKYIKCSGNFVFSCFRRIIL